MHVPLYAWLAVLAAIILWWRRPERPELFPVKASAGAPAGTSEHARLEPAAAGSGRRPPNRAGRPAKPAASGRRRR